MRDDGKGWIYLSRELAGDLLELADAELEVTRQEVGAVGRRLGKVVVLLIAVLCLVFWLVALLGYTLIAVASLWLPPWGAGLAVGGFFLLLALGLGLWAWSQIKKLENPVDIVIRRLREHLDWWRREARLHPSPPAAQAVSRKETPR